MLCLFNVTFIIFVIDSIIFVIRSVGKYNDSIIRLQVLSTNILKLIIDFDNSEALISLSFLKKTSFLRFF